ncbi:MAG TPA: DUF4124 domain-containing protein [Ramlibacter sp.]|jgi:hypothetical protein
MKLLVLAAALALTGQAGAQVFKCKDATGAVVYSQTACPAGVLIDGTKPRSAAAQAGAPLTQRREVDRASVQGSAAPPRPAPAHVVDPDRGCPSELDVRNIEAAMSARVVVKRQASLRQELRKAAACRSGSHPPYTSAEWDRMRAVLRGEGSDNDNSAYQDAGVRSGSVNEPPLSLTNCDGSGCWDTQGRRYNNAAGGYFRSDGVFCARSGPHIRCQ